MSKVDHFAVSAMLELTQALISLAQTKTQPFSAAIIKATLSYNLLEDGPGIDKITKF